MNDPMLADPEHLPRKDPETAFREIEPVKSRRDS